MTKRTEVSGSEMVELLAALIRTVSENPPGAERGVAEVLGSWLETRGVPTLIEPIGEGRANLVAKVAGAGRAPAVVFCGHMDTVPVGGTSWVHPPFGAEIVKGRLYGRGASDMKGALASFAAALVVLARGERALPGDVILAATAGEETDGIGVRALLDEGVFERGGAMIVGEPTGLKLAAAHKGALWLRVSIAGVSAHGSAPELGSNAILSMGRFLEAIPLHASFGGGDARLGRPTVSANQISGGIAPNVVPDRCDVTLDIRTFLGMSTEPVCNEIKRMIAMSVQPREASRSTVEVLMERLPVVTNETSPIVRAAMRARTAILGEPTDLTMMSYFTDASLIVQRHSLPTVILGPGELQFAHQTDECVDLERVRLASEIYARAAIEYFAEAAS